MHCRRIRWSLLAIPLCLTAGTAGFAQTPEFGSVPGPGEGGSGKSVGGNLAGGAGEEEKPPADPWYSAPPPATAPLQGYRPFRSPPQRRRSFSSPPHLRT